MNDPETPTVRLSARDLRVLQALDVGALTARDAGTNRDHVRRLAGRGLVAQTGTVRSGRVGRPAKLYERTAAGDAAVLDAS